MSTVKLSHIFTFTKDNTGAHRVNVILQGLISTSSSTVVDFMTWSEIMAAASGCASYCGPPSALRRWRMYFSVMGALHKAMNACYERIISDGEKSLTDDPDVNLFLQEKEKGAEQPAVFSVRPTETHTEECKSKAEGSGEKDKPRSASRSKIVEKSRSRKKRAKEGSGKEKTSDRKSKKDHHSIIKSGSKHRSSIQKKKSKISARSKREQ
ncbi:hypothetical protein TELCIR_07925 [Teladorsagia circumcincta]|uniref:Uncharacterized protein n=1 Tax=Teladorsagia circumcincta TaxID=45464 RepID=A0A2G9UL69_TELCI|nr:hypothetical protein TELCIR_07925 [Teladorsagia circumcincta]